MNRLYWCEIADGLAPPPFGGEFPGHMQAKAHPSLRAASRSAWNLLALALRELGYDALPQVVFEDGGKPRFADAPLHFSLSHSGRLAAVLVSDAPCGVDIEMIREDVRAKLENRCLSAREKEAGCDFFEIWPKKECIAKLDGRGLPARPGEICTLEEKYAGRFFSCRLSDSAGESYALSALCARAESLKAEKRTVIRK